MTIPPTLVITLPLIAAAGLVAVLDRIPRRLTQWLAIVFGALTLAGTIAVAGNVAYAGPIVAWIGGWHPGNRVGLGVALSIDLASASVAVLVATTVLAALVFAYQYFEKVGTIFYVLIFAMLGAMIAFSYTADIFNLFVWYEVFSVAAYALATYRSESGGGYRGALQFALTNSVAGLFFLVGITLLEGFTGELNLVAIGHSLAAHPHSPALVTTALAFIAIGLFTRGALAPLHFWFDEVHAAAPAPLSAILSGAMAPLALYGFARIYWSAFARTLPPSHALAVTTLGIGVSSAFYGTAMTLRESRLKRKLAHATVAHSGAALASIGTFTSPGLAAAALYEANYAVAAGALFFAIAIVRTATGERDARLLRGAGRSLPLTGIAFALATLSLASLWTNLRTIAAAAAPTSLVLTTLVVLVGAGTGGAFGAVFLRTWFGTPLGVRVRRAEKLPWFLIGPAIALALCSAAIAIAPAAFDLDLRAAASVVGRSVHERALVSHASLATWLAPVGALVVAGGILTRVRVVRRARLRIATSRIYRALHAIDNGDSGAYIAWIVGTAAVLAFGYSFAER